MIVPSYNDYKLLPLVDRIKLVVKLKRYNLGFSTDVPSFCRLLFLRTADRK